jgi:glyceraldehyde-3-phosphate dehydrogenase (NADP+)
MIEYGIYLGGRWLETKDKIIVQNPLDEEPIGSVSASGKAEMDKALERATEAFEIMKRLSAGERSSILLNLVKGIEERSDDIARTIALEAGKAIDSARLEVKRSISTLTWAAEEAKRINGEMISMDMLPAARTKIALNRRFPLGVILGISPFNFPLNLSIHKIAPAIAMGNSIILKPASYTPLSMMIFAEIAETTDLPKGALIVLPARGSDIEYLITHPAVQKVTFTGSCEVGWKIKELAFRKKVTLEMGGNAALVIHSDADLEKLFWEASFITDRSAFPFNGYSFISRFWIKLWIQ